MPGAVIAIDQDRPSGLSTGSPGIARNDLWLTRTIRPRCTTSGNSSFAWSFLSKPSTSSASLTGATTSTPHFDADVPGTYRLQLVTNGGGPGNIQVLVLVVRFDTNGYILQRWRTPGLGEQGAENNFSGQVRGWSESQEYKDQYLDEVVPYIFTGTTSGAGASVHLLDDAGNEFVTYAQHVYLLTVSAIAGVTSKRAHFIMDISMHNESGAVIDNSATRLDTSSGTDWTFAVSVTGDLFRMTFTSSMAETSVAVKAHIQVVSVFRA